MVQLGARQALKCHSLPSASMCLEPNPEPVFETTSSVKSRLPSLGSCGPRRAFAVSEEAHITLAKPSTKTLTIRLRMITYRFQSCKFVGNYHSTFEITYSGFILGGFNFVIISAKITVQNSIMNYFCNFRIFLQTSVLLVEAATDSKPGWAEDPLFPRKKTQLRMATNQIRLLWWATGQKDSRALLLTVEFILMVEFTKKNSYLQHLPVHVLKIQEFPALWPCGARDTS